MKIRPSRRGVVLATLMLGLAMVASACVPIHNTTPPNVNWKTHPAGTYRTYSALQLFTADGCRFTADSMAAAPASLGARVLTETRGTGCKSHHKAHTVVRARAHTNDLGWHYIECSTISWKCRADWSGGSFYLAVDGGSVWVPGYGSVEAGPILVRSPSGKDAEVRFWLYPGVEGHVNYSYTTHVLEAPSGLYFRHMSLHCGTQHETCD